MIKARVAKLEHKLPYWVGVYRNDNTCLTVGCFADKDAATIWARDVVELFSTLPQAEAENRLPPDHWDRVN